jgi:hypothetical protein
MGYSSGKGPFICLKRAVRYASVGLAGTLRVVGRSLCSLGGGWTHVCFGSVADIPVRR